MGRKRNKGNKPGDQSTRPGTVRDDSAVEEKIAAAEGILQDTAPPADISLPPWLEAWLVRHGAVAAVCGLLALLVAIVFGQTLAHEFIDLDDSAYIFDNSHVRAGLTPAGVVWAFSERYEANWHPLTWLSHMLDWQLFGLGRADIT